MIVISPSYFLGSSRFVEYTVKVTFLDSFGFRMKLFFDTIMYFVISPDALMLIFFGLSKSFVIVMARDRLLLGVVSPKVSSFGFRSKPDLLPTRKLVFIIVFSVFEMGLRISKKQIVSMTMMTKCLVAFAISFFCEFF